MNRGWNCFEIKSIGLTAAVLVLLMLGAACAPQNADQSAELSAQTARWTDALNSGNLEGLAAIYSADCVLMPPNAEMVKGQDGAKAVFGEMIDAGLTGGLDTIAAVAAGNVGYHTGTYWLQTQDGTIVDRGKYSEAWRKIDGEWKIVNDIWNSDWPADTSATTLVFTHKVRDADHWIAAFQGELRGVENPHFPEPGRTEHGGPRHRLQ
jgi:ketosteroid isomerase-like protein